MSRNYSCGQFEDSFQPKNLKIWAIGDFKSKSWSNSTIYSRSHKRRTDFICDDRGHLLPGVRKDPSTTWGQDVKAWVWEESSTTQNLSLIKKFRRDFRVLPSREVPKYFPKSPPRVQCTDDLSNFKLFLHRKVPILWIFGQPQVDIDQIRKGIVLQLVRFLGYTYIDMEYEIIRWKLAGDVLKTNPKLLENGGRIQIGGDVLEFPKKREDIEGIKRAIRFSTKLVRNPEESLNPKGVIECLRLALAQHFPAKGYIIDGFPFSEHEAALFEEEFYEVSAGIYFMSSNYSKNPQIEPQTIPAALFRRDEDYFERNVNEICDKISHKTIKIWSTEDMTPGHIKLLQNQVLKLTQDLMNINYPKTINYLTNTNQNQNQTAEETENCFIFRPKIEYLRDKVDPEYPPIYYPSKDNGEICDSNNQTPPSSAGSSIVSVQVDEILQTINECMSPESFYTSMGSQDEISDYESNWDADHYHGKLSNEKIQLRDRLQLLSHGSTAISSDYFGDFCSETGYNFNENDENDQDSESDDDLMLRECFSRKRIDGSEDSDSDFDSDFKEPKIDSHTDTKTNTRSRSVFDHLSEYSEISSVSQDSFSISTPLLRHTESTKSVQNFKNFKNLDFDFGLKRRGSKRPVSQDTQYTSSCSEEDEQPENSLQLKSLVKPFSSDVYESDEKNSDDSLDFEIRGELGSGDQVPRFSQNDRYYSPNQSGDWVENNLSELDSGQNSPISNRINRPPVQILSSATSYCSNSNRNCETTKYRSDPYDYELPPQKRPNIFKFSNLSKSNSFSPISPNNVHNQKNLEHQRFLSEHILTENNTNNQSNNIKRTIICRKRGPHGRLLGVFLAPKTANNNRQIIHRK